MNEKPTHNTNNFDIPNAQGCPQGHRKHSREQALLALTSSAAIISAAAIMLRIHRSTMYYYVKDYNLWPEIREIEEGLLDLAEGKAIEAINNGSENMVRFYLETKGKHRGYTKRQELTGLDGGPVEVKPDFSAYTTAELRQINDLHKCAAERDAGKANGSAAN